MIEISTLLGIPKVLFSGKSLRGELISVRCVMISVDSRVRSVITGFAIAVHCYDRK